MDDFSFSGSYLDILFLLVKSLIKFDTLEGDCNLPFVYLSQNPVYSKKELQSQPITFRRHHFDIYLYFSLFVFSVIFLPFFLFCLSSLWPPPAFYFILFLIIYFRLC